MMKIFFTIFLFSLLSSASALPPRSRIITPSANQVIKGRWFDRIVIVNLENTDFGNALSNPALKQFSRQGVLLSNYHAITHPSQPNYIAQIYGSPSMVVDDGFYILKGRSLVDLLEERGISWRAYQENYPSEAGIGCYSDMASLDGLYVRKHNPFMSMMKVSRNPQLCAARIVNERQFTLDLSNDALPQLCYYTPNMDNDGHDTSVDYAGNWFEKGFLAKYLRGNDNLKNTLLFVTFDEQENYEGDNKVYAVLFGPPVEKMAGRVIPTLFDHYSLLRTIEENWGLGTLGRNDDSAKPFFPL